MALLSHIPSYACRKLNPDVMMVNPPRASSLLFDLSGEASTDKKTDKRDHRANLPILPSTSPDRVFGTHKSNADQQTLRL
jgi:hypothetical protein